MTEYLQEYWKYLLAALVLHAAIASLFFVTLLTQPVRVSPQLAIQATVVDARTLERIEQRPRVEEQQRREREEQVRLERERAEAEERERVAEERRQEQAAAQRAEEQAEKERQAELQRQAEIVEKQRQAEVQRKQQEAERARQAEAERQKRAAAEKERVAEIERRQREEAEKRRAAENARLQAERESDLQRQLAEEDALTQAQNAGLQNQYVALIEQRVYRNWNKPASARPGIECQVRVTQAQGGTVLSAEVTTCNGDAAVRQLIEAAVLRSSPLPPPPDPRLFQRNLLLIFKPAE